MKPDGTQIPLYEPENRQTDHLFGPLLLLTLLAFLGLGMYMRTRPAPPPKAQSKSREGIQTSFIIPEEKPKPPPPPPPVAKKKPAEQKPVDLTDNPVPKQKEEVRVEKKTEEKAEPKQKKKARPVYGLRKVYSRGLGASGSAGDAVIGKLGNTLNKSIDDDSATVEDLRGEVVSTTTIEQYPQFRRKPRPEYSPEMLENKIEGVVKVKCLIDMDGTVKKAVPLNDIGYDSKTLARRACLEALFDPALREGKPVAVWIVVPIRFKILG